MPEDRLVEVALAGVLDRGTIPYLHMLLFDLPTALRAAERVTHALRPSWRTAKGPRLDKFRGFLRILAKNLERQEWENLRAKCRRVEQLLVQA